jgi:hypothetical protein
MVDKPVPGSLDSTLELPPPVALWEPFFGGPTPEDELIPLGYIFGMTLSNSGAAGSLNQTLNIAAGTWVDSTGNYVFKPAAMTKTLANFATGSGTGGLGSAAQPLAANQWYHVFAIWNPATQGNDVYFDVATAGVAPAPTALPAGFTTWRRIGSILTNASKNITLFFQTGNHFQMSGVLMLNAAGAFSGFLRALCPPGIACIPFVGSLMSMTGTAASANMQLFDGGSSSSIDWFYYGFPSIQSTAGTAQGNGVAGAMAPQTNTSGQIFCIVGVNGAPSSAAFQLFGEGWIDPLP